jgi:hypothetical protein
MTSKETRLINMREELEEIFEKNEEVFIGSNECQLHTIDDVIDWHKKKLQSIISEWHESKFQKPLIEIIRTRLSEVK